MDLAAAAARAGLPHVASGPQPARGRYADGAVTAGDAAGAAVVHTVRVPPLAAHTTWLAFVLEVPPGYDTTREVGARIVRVFRERYGHWLVTALAVLLGLAGWGAWRLVRRRRMQAT